MLRRTGLLRPEQGVQGRAGRKPEVHPQGQAVRGLHEAAEVVSVQREARGRPGEQDRRGGPAR